METSNEVAAGDASMESRPWQLLQATLRNPWVPPGSWTLVVVLETSTGVVQVTLASSFWTGSAPIQTSTWCTYACVTSQPTLCSQIFWSTEELQKAKTRGLAHLDASSTLWLNPFPTVKLCVSYGSTERATTAPIAVLLQIFVFWRVTPARLTITYPFDES